MHAAFEFASGALEEAEHAHCCSLWSAFPMEEQRIFEVSSVRYAIDSRNVLGVCCPIVVIPKCARKNYIS